MAAYLSFYDLFHIFRIQILDLELIIFYLSLDMRWNKNGLRSKEAIEERIFSIPKKVH